MLAINKWKMSSAWSQLLSYSKIQTNNQWSLSINGRDEDHWTGNNNNCLYPVGSLHLRCSRFNYWNAHLSSCLSPLHIFQSLDPVSLFQRQSGIVTGLNCLLDAVPGSLCWNQNSVRVIPVAIQIWIKLLELAVIVLTLNLRFAHFKHKNVSAIVILI